MVSEILIWWLVVQALGLAGLPLAGLVFRPLPDGGYAFAKPLGLLLTGYLAWLLAMFGLGGFGAPLLIISALAVAGLGVWLRGGPRALADAARAAWPERRAGILGYEALFLAAMLFAVWIRAHDPTPWGTERPMDYAFFNAIQRGGSFPPADPWLAGFSLNYYYFGYLLMAAVAQLSGLTPPAAYNLSLALIFGLTALGSAGMIANLMLLAARQAPAEGWRRARSARAGWQPSISSHPPESGRGAAEPQGPAVLESEAQSPTADREPPAAHPRPPTPGRQTPSRAALALFPLLGAIFVLVASNQIGALQVFLGDNRVVALDTRQLIAVVGQRLSGAERLELPYPSVSADFGELTALEPRDRWNDFDWWLPSRTVWDEYRSPETGGPDRRYAITEFPLFSFRLGDMHPHVMSLPFGLLATALALATLARPAAPAFAQGRKGWAELALAGVILGSLYAINSWDLPTYMLLYAGALALLFLRLADGGAPLWGEYGRRLALVALAAFLLFAPFHLTFRSLVGGAEPLVDLPLIGRLTSILGLYPAARSGLHNFVIIFGLFAAPLIAFVYMAWPRRTAPAVAPAAEGWPEPAEEGRWTPGGAPLGIVAGRAGLELPALLPWLPPALLLIGLLLGFPYLALAGLGLLALAAAARAPERGAEAFALLVVALGCAVLFGTEVVYIRDIFEGWSTRFNTIFKFYYQVWLLWGALAPFALWWLLARAEGRGRVVAYGVAALSAGLLAGALVYPAVALRDLGRGESFTLAGRTPRELSDAGLASVEWLRRNAAPGSVVLEAAKVENRAEVAAGGATPHCTGSYNGEGYAGISAATGLPTLLGWVGHQTQWRGGDAAAREELTPRCIAVDTIYATPDPAAARELLARYGVDYVYVGGLERGLYPPESLAKFDQLGAAAFSQDEVTIYRIAGEDQAPAP